MHTNLAARRRLIALLGTAAILATVLSSGAAGVSAAASGLGLTKIAAGFDSPVFLTNARDGSGRLFVVEQTGKIKIVKNGVVRSTPFLDLTSLVSKGGEQGLLGLAFHPSYKTNGLFYVNYTRTNGDTVIQRYKVSATDPNVAVRASAYTILTIAQPYDNHNGGMLAFGPDGFLYIGTGDGGNGGDPGNRAQSLTTLLGKMLRIDINGSVGTRHYKIPSSNPYVGKAGADEIWSRGLRNPWRFSFDHKTGTLWIGDVGQGSYEEIDRATNTTGSGTRGRGANYGWRVLEGRHCYNPSSGCSTAGKVAPVVEYSHSDGCAVTGGYAYRGTRVPALAGRYIFADFCSGTIWAISQIAGIPATKSVVLTTTMAISSFGEDGSNELYVVDHNGAIYKFEAR